MRYDLAKTCSSLLETLRFTQSVLYVFRWICVSTAFGVCATLVTVAFRREGGGGKRLDQRGTISGPRGTISMPPPARAGPEPTPKPVAALLDSRAELLKRPRFSVGILTSIRPALRRRSSRQSTCDIVDCRELRHACPEIERYKGQERSNPNASRLPSTALKP
jgi:hypothetical protein